MILRIGSEANRSDRQRFDGAHTTLRVSAIDDDRFGGTWTSAEAAEERRGTFCAVRSRDRSPGAGNSARPAGVWSGPEFACRMRQGPISFDP